MMYAQSHFNNFGFWDWDRVKVRVRVTIITNYNFWD